jgi:inosine/xanthosine triphosphate pyrophosphatase family protein
MEYLPEPSRGEITLSKVGKEGFGYDLSHKPEGYQQTFAELSSELKIRSATGEEQHNSSAFEKRASKLSNLNEKFTIPCY